MADLSLLVRQLQLWSEENVFVSDQASERGNAALDTIGLRAQTSSFNHRCQSINLPDNYSYRVYYFPKSLTRGNLPNDGTWYKAADLLNKEQLRFWIYDDFGKVFPLESTFILGFGNSVIVALRGATMNMVFNNGVSSNNLFVTFWKNPHPEKPISVITCLPVYDRSKRRYVTDYTTFNTASKDLASNATVSIYQNGNDVPLANLTLGTADVIEMVTETDVFCEFDVTIDDDLTGYNSDLYKDYREILHMPKALNPVNLILLHDNIDVVVRDPISRNGLYLGRYDDRSVRQITHQDYSVNRTDVDALRDNLHATTIIASVRVRNPYRQFSLDRDANYIKDLYRCDDQTIINFLRGTLDSRFTFWKAQTLEEAGWLSLAFSNGSRNLIFDSSVKYPQLQSSLEFFTQSLGYYNTAAVLSQSLKQGQWDEDQMIVYVPPALYNYDVYCYVFVDGKKLSESLYTVKRKAKDVVEISLLQGPYPDKSKINVITRDASGGMPYTFTPTQSNPVLSGVGDDFLLYSSTDGVNFTVLNRNAGNWILSKNAQGTNDITFTSEVYGQTIYYVPRNNAQRGSVNIDSILNDTAPIILTLRDLKNNPVWQANHIDVFLNGKWLINGVDFILIDTPIGKKLFISNKNFLFYKESGNEIDWFTTADYVVCDDVGYVVNNQLPLEKTPYVVERGMSNVFIEGQLIFDFNDMGSFLLTNGITDCSASEVILPIPYQVEQLLSLDDQENDINRRMLINAYFANKNVITKPKVITKQHEVYSLWLQQLINNLARGTLKAVDDADDDTFIDQFPDPDNLRSNDPALVKENLINRDFVAVSASYNDSFPVTDQPTAKIVQRLINLLLVRPFFTVGENFI